MNKVYAVVEVHGGIIEELTLFNEENEARKFMVVQAVDAEANEILEQWYISDGENYHEFILRECDEVKG